MMFNRMSLLGALNKCCVADLCHFSPATNFVALQFIFLLQVLFNSYLTSALLRNTVLAWAECWIPATWR